MLKPVSSKRLGMGPDGGERHAEGGVHYAQASSVKAAGRGSQRRGTSGRSAFELG